MTAKSTGAPTSSCSITSAAWEPLTFAVHCTGELPADGRAELRAAGGAASQVILKADATDPSILRGQVDRLVDSITYQLYLGDAWTDPATVEVIPLPVVDDILLLAAVLDLQLGPLPPAAA